MSKNEELIPLPKALLQIFLITLLVSGSATLIWLYREHIKVVGSKDDRYNIVAMIQTGPQPQQLPSDYLIEVLELSVDKPTNLYLFDTKKAEKKLLATPFIRGAKVKKVKPNAISVDYTLRRPIAKLIDQEKVGVDQEGKLFPLEPFYSLEGLPQLRFEKSEHFSLALSLMDLLPAAKEVDLLQVDSEIIGEREIRLVTEEEHALRLHPIDYKDGIRRYQRLKETLLSEDPVACDLRLPKLAYLNQL